MHLSLRWSGSKPLLKNLGPRLLGCVALLLVGSATSKAALPFPHLKVFEHYAVYWPQSLALKPRFLPSIQNGTLLTGTFQGTEVTAWLSQGALRKSLRPQETEAEWTEALQAQRAFEGLENRSLGCQTLGPGWVQCSATGTVKTATSNRAPRYVAQNLFFDSGRARILVQARSSLSEAHALAFLSQLKLKRTLPPQKKKKTLRTSSEGKSS